MSEQADRDALAEVIGGHLPQSRGAGRWPGCFSHPRVEDWTPGHLAEVVLASDWLAERDRRVAAEALRRFADSRGVNVGDEDDDYWRGYRQAQRECLHDAVRVADSIERGE